MPNSPDNLLKQLFDLIEDRKLTRIKNSYTSALFDKGQERIAQKVGEEAVEVVIAAMKNNKSELIDEASDLVFHLFVLLSNAGVKLEDIIFELQKRRMKRDHDRD